MTTTPEGILARFAAEYEEHGRGSARRLVITTRTYFSKVGYVVQSDTDSDIWWTVDRGRSSFPFSTADIHRIDYSNARYRGDRPLWERERRGGR